MNIISFHNNLISEFNKKKNHCDGLSLFSMEPKKKEKTEENIEHPLTKLTFTKKIVVTVGDTPSIKRIVAVYGCFISLINPTKDSANIEIFIPHWNATIKHVGQHTTLFLNPTGYIKAQNIKIKSKHNDIMEELLKQFLMAKENFMKYSLEFYQSKCKVTMEGKPVVAKISLANNDLQVSAHSKLVLSKPRNPPIKANVQFEDATKVDIFEDESCFTLMFKKPELARIALVSFLSKPVIKEEIKKVSLTVPDVPYIGNAFLDVLNETSEVAIENNQTGNQGEVPIDEQRLSALIEESGRLTTNIRQSRKYKMKHDTEDSDTFSTSVSMSMSTLNNPEAYQRALQRRKEKLEAKALSRNKSMSNETLELLTNLNAEKQENETYPTIKTEGLTDFDPLFVFQSTRLTEVFTKDVKITQHKELTYLDKVDVELCYNTINNIKEIKAMNLPPPKPLMTIESLYEKIEKSPNKPNIAAHLLYLGRKYPLYHVYIAIKDSYRQQDGIMEIIKKYPFYNLESTVSFFNLIFKNGLGTSFFEFLHHLVPTISYMYYSDSVLLIPELCDKISVFFEKKQEGKLELDWISSFDTSFLRVYNHTQQFCEFPAQCFIEDPPASTPLTSLLSALLIFVVPTAFDTQTGLVDKFYEYSLTKPNKQLLSSFKSKKPLKQIFSFLLSIISNGTAPKWILDVAVVKNLKNDELAKHYVVSSCLKRVYEACDKDVWNISDGLRESIISQILQELDFFNLVQLPSFLEIPRITK